MEITTVQQLFNHELGDIYDAEHRFLAAQQEMLEVAGADTLRAGLEHHIAQTQDHIAQLEKVFALLEIPAKRETCDASKGLVSEYEKGIAETSAPELRDILVSNSATKCEHYEISAYRGLIAHAQQVGLEEVAMLLQQNLQQEEIAAAKLEENAPMLVKLALKNED